MNSSFLLLFMLVPYVISWQVIRVRIPPADLENCEELFITKCKELTIYDIKCVEYCERDLNTAIEEVKVDGKCTEKTGSNLNACITAVYKEAKYRERHDKGQYHISLIRKSKEHPQ